MLDVNIKSKQFKSSEGAELDVLNLLQFVCEENSFTCIVGPSGCGKTTTLRCILGLDTDFDGTVSVDDTHSRHKMAAVFQEPRLLPWRTVEQNVQLALNDVAVSVNNATFHELFAELGLSDHISLYPNELSLGLARRVSLARAFAVNPSVLILDEPFVSLDNETAARLRRLLVKVWSARSCIALMVTHNIDEAIELADRILFFSGSPASVGHEHRISVPRAERSLEMVKVIRAEIDVLVAGG